MSVISVQGHNVDMHSEIEYTREVNTNHLLIYYYIHTTGKN